MRKRLVINQLLAICTLLCYGSVLFPPANWVFFGFFAISIPLCMALNFCFFWYWIAYKRFLYSLLALGVLLLGYPFFHASWGWSFENQFMVSNTFSVLSYNVRAFNSWDRKDNYETAQKMITWLQKDTSSIKCIQEFFLSPQQESLNTLQMLGQDTNYRCFFKPALTDKRGRQFGLAIFSKYPIVEVGEVDLRDKSYNDAIYADVLVGQDTVRIYNVHLQSMKINQTRIADTDTENFKENFIDLAKRLRRGFIARSRQIDFLAQHIAQTQHPLILCGDLNDVPYSYTYFRLRRFLGNAFENSGKGFGISFNSAWLFVRIDNQFYNKTISNHNFFTESTVLYSDHFPIRGLYSVKK